MMIFRILCGEWIEPLWDCMRAENKEVLKSICYEQSETESYRGGFINDNQVNFTASSFLSTMSKFGKFRFSSF